MSLDALARDLEHELAGGVHRGRPLARLTTYRLGGPAAIYVEPANLADVDALARVLAGAGDVEVLALGRGSNLVISDQGWPGVVVRLGPGWGEIAPASARAPESSELAGLSAGAAAPLPTLANWAARRALEGLEFLVAIPGSVGGGVKMNAGAHGGDIAGSLHSVRLVDLDSGNVGWRRAPALDLSYRRSSLGARELALEARFELRRGRRDDIARRMETYRRHRAETQPGALQNAGSVFKNPPGDSAGRLVETAGLKGFSVRGASVSDLHANFFIAPAGASAQDVYDLVHAVRARVSEAFGVELEPEIRFAGPFEHRSDARPGAVRW